MSKLTKTKKKLHSQLLVMTAWRKDIPEEQKNIIIANALNYCTYYEGLEIIGYLITKRRVFLIAYSEHTPFNEILRIFFYQVAVGIIEYKTMLQMYDGSKKLLQPDGYSKLFKKFPFYNIFIKKIITGQEKEIDIKYYDPHLARLEDQIHNYNYSSAIDYSGAKSPVVVHISHKINLR